MTFLDYITENYGMLFEVIGLIIMLSISVHISKKMKIFTIAAVSLMFIETIVFHLEKWTQTFETLSIARPLLTATLYSIYPIILILMLGITAGTMSKKVFWLLMIPEILSIPAYYSSQWTRIVFYFKEDNHYSGGLIPSLPYFIFIFYAIVFVFVNFKYLKNYYQINKLIIGYIVIGPFAGVGMYIASSSEKDYIPFFGSAMLLYFIFMYIHMAKVDPLTSLLSRQSYYKDLENSRNINCVVSIDMNYLKYYNDNMGHEAGDKALATVSKIMRENSGPNGIVYRVGGDEFVILYSGVSEQEVQQRIQTMRDEMAKTEYACAFGYSMRLPGESIHDTIRKSDELMYINKAIMKKEGRAIDYVDPRIQ